MPPKKKKGLIEPSVIEYKALPKRKLLKKTCEFFNYGVTKDSKGQICQVAPYFDRKGKLKAQHLRYPNKMMPWTGKVKRLQMFGQHLWETGGRKVIITEGEIDCMSVAQVLNFKWPTVSLPSGVGSAQQAIKENLDFLETFQEVVLMFDNDAPGKEAISKVVDLFTPGKVKIFRYPNDDFKDANDILQACLGSFIVNGVFKAVTYRPDGIISGEELLEEVLSEPEKGYDILYPEMSKMFQGLRHGELYLFTAGSGIGKSTIVHEIAYDLMMRHDQKIGVLALEENRKKTAKRYPGIYLNHPLILNRQGLTDLQIEEAFKKTTGSGKLFLYDHWGSLNLDRLISKIRYMIKGLGCKWIVLDHISIVVSGLDEMEESERKLIDKLMTRLRSLIEETQASVLAIVHLSRATDNSTKGWNEGKQISLRSLRGSGALEQLSDGVIALERDQQGEDKDESLLRILKNRAIGLTGLADTLLYNHDTGRLLPIREVKESFDFDVSLPTKEDNFKDF